jgi:hypothetical protein
MNFERKLDDYFFIFFIYGTQPRNLILMRWVSCWGDRTRSSQVLPGVSRLATGRLFFLVFSSKSGLTTSEGHKILWREVSHYAPFSVLQFSTSAFIRLGWLHLILTHVMSAFSLSLIHYDFNSCLHHLVSPSTSAFYLPINTIIQDLTILEFIFWTIKLRK